MCCWWGRLTVKWLLTKDYSFRPINNGKWYYCHSLSPSWYHSKLAWSKATFACMIADRFRNGTERETGITPVLNYLIDERLHMQNTILSNYCKFPKYSDTQNSCCNHSKIWTMWLYHRVMSPNDADRMANNVDTDQTAPDLSLHCLPRHICPKT